MYLIVGFLLIFISYFTKTDQTIVHSFSNNLNILSTNNWILYPPWKRFNDYFFNNPPNNSSVEYFNINERDHITNESYIETPKLTVCNEVNITFYSKVNNSYNQIKFILFIYKQNIWNKQWEYINENSQWQIHQIKIHLTNKNEDIRLRFLPISNSSNQNSITIAIFNITTQTNCEKSQLTIKNHSSKNGKTVPIHPFLFMIFGSAFLLIFVTVMIIYIYGLISKQYHQWQQNRSSQRQKKERRKSRNVIRDETTILGVD